MGKFIVLDGTDGSGKTTQTALLVERLRRDGFIVETADFPQYGQPSAAFVERYLRGEFGSAEEVGAQRGALFYALDRYAASFQIRSWLKEGKMVISNRYVSASKGHQLGKLKPEERQKFLDWLNELEYGIMGIPKPDLTLFLHLPPEIGQTLVDQKGAREYLGGRKRDLHEADLNHLKNAEQAYLFCLEHDLVERWERIVCFDGKSLRSKEEVQEEIYSKVKKLL